MRTVLPLQHGKQNALRDIYHNYFHILLYREWHNLIFVMPRFCTKLHGRLITMCVCGCVCVCVCVCGGVWVCVCGFVCGVGVCGVGVCVCVC